MILIAPDSFKGTFSAREVAALIAEGVGPRARCLPVADGGEGTLEVLADALSATFHTTRVTNPWGHAVDARWALTSDGRAIVELAQASGLTLAPENQRDPWSASTFGTGELIAAAARAGAQDILVAVGGSATTDGGAGAVEAIQRAGGLGGATITVLADVTTTFRQAARVFGPQKGADPEMVERLTRRLEQQAANFPKDPTGVPRTGAAGGCAGGLWAHFNAQLVSGADAVLDLIAFDEAAAAAEIVVVGEGRLDSQTGQGKIIEAIRRRVGNTPLVAVVGSVDENLGDYGTHFSEIMVASTAQQLVDAGRVIAAG